MDMIRIVMIGMGIVFLAVLAGQYKKEYAMYITLAGTVCILCFSVMKLQTILTAVDEIESSLHMDPALMQVLVKMLGITYTAEFAAGLCRDAGYGAVGMQIEMFAKLSVMAVSVPVLHTLIATMEGILGI